MRSTKNPFRATNPRIYLFLGFIMFFLTSALPLLTADELDEPYLIGPEDILDITVWRDPDLSKKVIVRPDGNISFPLIGEIKVGGHSVEWLQNEITKRITEYVPEAVVTVMVLDVKGNKFYVVGKVIRPGVYKIGRKINVIQALAMSGGLTPFANETNILVLRYDDKGGYKKLRFDYSEVKKGKHLEQNVWLKDGDVIVVP